MKRVTVLKAADDSKELSVVISLKMNNHGSLFMRHEVEKKNAEIVEQIHRAVSNFFFPQNIIVK